MESIINHVNLYLNELTFLYVAVFFIFLSYKIGYNSGCNDRHQKRG